MILQRLKFTAHKLWDSYDVKMIISKFANSLLTNDPYKYKNFPKS